MEEPVTFFSHDQAGVQADIYSMAKGMGNGFPVAGILIAPFLKPKHGMLGTTFGGNHLACAAALAVLEVIEEEKLMENAKSTGEFLISSLKKIDGLKNVRGKGLMIGFDLEMNLKDLRKNLLNNQQVFTGEAKPNTIRLLAFSGIKKKRSGGIPGISSKKKYKIWFHHLIWFIRHEKFYFHCRCNKPGSPDRTGTSV